MPMLVLLGVDDHHPPEMGRQIAALAPVAELLERWKDPDRVESVPRDRPENELVPTSAAGAKRGAIVGRNSATQDLAGRSIHGFDLLSSNIRPHGATVESSFASRLRLLSAPLHMPRFLFSYAHYRISLTCRNEYVYGTRITLRCRAIISWSLIPGKPLQASTNGAEERPSRIPENCQQDTKQSCTA